MFEPIYAAGFDMNPYKMDDWELVYLAKDARWPAATEILVVRHIGWVKPMVVQLARNQDHWHREDSEDAEQDAAIAIIAKAIERYDLDQYLKPGGCSFYTFAAMVVHDWLVDFVKKEHRARKRLGISLDAALEAADGSPAKDGPAESVAAALASTRDDPAAAAELGEQIELLRNAIPKLPQQQRKVMELDLAGMRTHEMADKLGISEEAVKGRKKRAIEKLRELLAP